MKVIRILCFWFLAAVALAGAPASAATCWDNDADGFFAGSYPSVEEIGDGRQYDNAVALDPQGNPIIAWRDGNGIRLTRWDGAAWVKMDGTAGADLLAYPDYHSRNPQYFRLALDGAGRPAVFWMDYWGYAFASFAHWDGTKWCGMDGVADRDDLSEIIGRLNPSDVQMALDGNGRPYLVASVGADGGSEILLTRWDGGKWATMAGSPGAENISNDASYSWWPRLVVDGADRPWVVWADGMYGAYDLVMTRWDGTKWATAGGLAGTERLTASPQDDVDHRIVMAVPDKLAIVWAEREYATGPESRGSSRLLFTRWDGTKWARMDGAAGMETLEAGVDGEFEPQLQLDSAGSPAIVWNRWEYAGGFAIRYSRWDGASWARADGTPGADTVTTMRAQSFHYALDHLDRPQIVWYGWKNLYNVFFSRWNGSGWSGFVSAAGDFVSAPLGNSFDPHIVIDAAGRPQLTWFSVGGSSTDSWSGVFASFWDGSKWAPRLNPCGTLGDCNDGNPFVHPGAQEICTDGIDNDCNYRIDTQDFACPRNLTPVANAGVDQTVHQGGTASLDGSASADPDGNYPLAYAWTITAKPEGSAAALSDAAAVNPTFVVDLPGDYLAELVVADAFGLVSGADQMRVSSVNSAPVAAAGLDQSVVLIGTTVQLDGSGSYDEDGDATAYGWEIVSRPAGSAAVLSDAAAANPAFVADVHGDYLLQLTVRDPWVAGAPDTVLVSFQNLRPVAVAGPDQGVVQGDSVVLDGGLSSDANADPLAFQWALTSVPAGSQATLFAAGSALTGFLADLPGVYVASLLVSDGIETSDPSNVTVVAVSRADALQSSLLRLLEEINALPDAAFEHPTLRGPLAKKVSVVIQLVEAGNYEAALEKLQNDVMKKMDGCATQGEPDANDWIVDCSAQAATHPHAVDAEHLLREILNQ